MTRLEVLRPFIEQTVKEYLGVEELLVNEDGTIPIRAGSTSVNVVLTDGPGDQPLLRVVAPTLHDVAASPELYQKLNEMNAAFSFARAFWSDGVVYIAMDLLAESLDKQQVALACSLISFAADSWDDELQRVFGGKTVFSDSDGKGPGDTGGYL